MSTIEQIDAAIGRYYNSLNKGYDNNFALYCDDNGVDDEAIVTEIEEDPEDSAMVDFDDNFPYPFIPENKHQFIMDLITKCYKDPNIFFGPTVPQFNQGFFTMTDDEISGFKKKLKSQCPTMYKMGFENSNDLVYIMAIGYKHKFDYLYHLIDDYNRDRVKHRDEATTWNINDWSDPKYHRHFRAIQDIPNAAKVASSVNMFARHGFPYLAFNPVVRINDSLQTTITYLCAAIDWIGDIIKRATTSIFPFQVDVCINYGKPITLEKVQTQPDDAADDDINHKLFDNFLDIVGDIEAKLIKNRFKYLYKQTQSINSDVLYSTECLITGWLRCHTHFLQMVNNDIITALIHSYGGDWKYYPITKDFLDLFHEFREKQQVENFPNWKRFIMFIDRRNRLQSKMDDIWMYECDRNITDIPKDALSEWYFNSSRTCLLPNMEYLEDVDLYEKYRSHDDVILNSNISSGDHCKQSLLTFSFHVKEKKCVKCYVCWKGQVIRFMPEDIKNILPKLFYMEWNDGSTFNHQFVPQNEKLIQELIERMNKVLIDQYFQAFRASYH